MEKSVFSYIHTACQIKIYHFFLRSYTILIYNLKIWIIGTTRNPSSSRVVTGHENVKMSTETLSVKCPLFLKINQNKDQEKGFLKNLSQGLKRFSFLSLKKYTGKAIPRRELGRTVVQMTFWNVALEEWESYAGKR